MTKKEIIARLQEHYNYITNEYCNASQVLGIFLYGSQNYGTDSENSDVDSLAIIVPSIKDMALNPPLSIEVKMLNGEHCIIKDIREMLKMWKKQNINFLEVLYTEYFIVNPIFRESWVHLVLNREYFVHYDIEKMTKSICGQTLHTLKENPNDPKKISNALRLSDFLNNFIGGASFENCLKNEKLKDFYKDIKMGKTTAAENAKIVDAVRESLILIQTKIPKVNFEQKANSEIVMNNVVVYIIERFNSNGCYGL